MTELRIARTVPFRNFQRRVGRATFYINTIVVGLELVAAGGEKPQGLNISWEAPQQRRQAVDQARSFAFVAILNLTFDAFDVYLSELAKINWLPADERTRKVMGKAVTGPGGYAYSERERAQSLAEALEVETPELLCVHEFLSTWRNTLIHTSSADNRLRSATRAQLLNLRQYLSDKYANLDVESMLKHYDEFQEPSLKEATSLTAAAQNLARTLDEAVINRAAKTESAVEGIAYAILFESLGPRLTRLPELWGKDAETRARKLRSLLEAGGLTVSSDGNRRRFARISLQSFPGCLGTKRLRF